MNYLEQQGSRRLSQGYTVIPILAGQKRPGISDWRNTSNVNDATIQQWVDQGNAGVGIVCGDGLIALDVDVMDGFDAAAVHDYVVQNLAAFPVKRVGKAPKSLYVFRTPDTFRKLLSKKYVSPAGKEQRVEVLSVGQQFVSDGIHPDTGQPYVWPEGDLPARVDLPHVTERALRELILWWESRVPDDWTLVLDGNVDGVEPRTEVSVDSGDLFSRMRPPIENLSLDTMREQLNFIAEHRPGALGYDYWMRVGRALWHQFEGDEVGYELFEMFSRHSDKYDPGELEWKWSSQLDWRHYSKVTTYASIIFDYQNIKGSLNVAEVADQILGVSGISDSAPDHAQGFEPIDDTSDVSVPERSDVSDIRDERNETTPRDKATAYLLANGLNPDQLHAALAPIDWVVRDFVPSDSIGFIYGPPASYKSFVAFDVALCVASGQRWHDNELCRPGGVMIVAGEGQGGLARRFAAWRQVSGAELSGKPLIVTKGAVMLDTVDGIQSATTLGRALEISHGVDMSLIVVDTLARNTAGDENKAQDVAAIIKAADTLRKTFGCAVMLVHHTGKNVENGLRGSSALHGAADWEYLAMREGEDCMELSCQKTKDAREPEPRYFRSREVDIEGDWPEKLDSLVLDRIERSDMPEENPELGLPKGAGLAVLRLLQKQGGDSEAAFGGLAVAAVTQLLIDDELYDDDVAGKKAARAVVARLVKAGHLRRQDEMIYVENWA